MIDTVKLEKWIKELKDSEEGELPFNKFTEETKNSLAFRQLEMVKEMNQEIIDRKHQLVIDGHEIVRLHDIVDGKEDYYWAYNKWVGFTSTESGEYLSSAVGHFTPLKGFLPDEEYNRLVYFWNLNNYEKAV